MTKSFSTSINNFWLYYLDDEITKKYNDNMKQLQGKLFKWIGYLQVIIFAGLSILYIIKGYALEIRIACGLFSLIQFIVQITKHKLNWLVNLNPAICLGFYLWYFIDLIFFQYMQNLIGSHQELGKMYFYYGAGFLFVSSLQVYLIKSWVAKEVYVLVGWEYFAFRVFGPQQAFLQVPIHISIIILMPMLLYQIDKFNKKNFFDLFQQQQNQKELQCQIIQQTSSAIFITNINNEQELKCIFANSNCKNELQIQNESKVIDCLQYITVLSNKNYQKDSNQLQNIQLEELILQFHQQLLEEAQLKSCEIILSHQPLFRQLYCQFYFPSNFQGKNNKSGDDNQQKKYFLVKLMECVWEQKKVIMTILENINDHVMNTRLQEVDKYKDNLLASVTHDLKTPINCIISFTKSAMEAKDEATVRNCLEVIQQNAQLQKYLINDILDFSQYKNKKLKINISDFSISELAREVIDMFKDQSSIKNIQLILHLVNFQNVGSGGKGDIVSSDCCRIKQILINLISNAFKYTLKGSITVTIERINFSQDQLLDQEQSSSFALAQQEKLKISVEDTGIGIPEEIQGQLFQLYGTYNHSSKQLNRNGIGLGLTICKKLVKILGPYKKVFFKSQVEIGTTFTFYIYSNLRKLKCASIPAHQIKQKYFNYISNNYIQDSNDVVSSEFIEKEKELKILTSHYKRKEQVDKGHTQINRSILIVDDNIYNIQAIKVMMQKYNQFKIYSATNGFEALNLYNQHIKEGCSPFSLVLTDIQMPIMDGTEMISKIRSLERQLQIPKSIITVISADDSKDLKFYQNLGADYNISKPIDAVQLSGLLNLIETQ